MSAGKTCIQLIDGQWSTSHQLKTHREHHCSWTSLNGDVLIIGINKQTKVNLIYFDKMKSVLIYMNIFLLFLMNDKAKEKHRIMT